MKMAYVCCHIYVPKSHLVLQFASARYPEDIEGLYDRDYVYSLFMKYGINLSKELSIDIEDGVPSEAGEKTVGEKIK